MKLSDFDFNLPEELIASQPLAERDASRMLIVNGNQLSDLYIKNFIDFLQPGDVVVFNNSKVIPCRFMAGDFEITLHTKGSRRPPGAGTRCSESPGYHTWWGLTRKFNKINIGDELQLDDGSHIEILDKNDESGLLIKFENDVFETLDKVGKMPLPPYMKRDEEASDRERYQTVYAKEMGSMAAPTAGLHFTDEMMTEIAKRATIVHITLHVGAGTWMSVKDEDISKHVMHAEYCVVTPEQAEIINSAKRIIAVGTTSMRTLEAAAAVLHNQGGACFSETRLSQSQSGCEIKDKRIAPINGETDIFITPGYRFKAVDVLLTNFHLPKSTLMMLVSAFAGTEEMQAAYAHAIRQKYRFFSYGDCCLLFRKDSSGT